MGRVRAQGAPKDQVGAGPTSAERGRLQEKRAANTAVHESIDSISSAAALALIFTVERAFTSISIPFLKIERG